MTEIVKLFAQDKEYRTALGLPDEITEETTFTDDLGADSLDLYQIKMGIEEEFGLTIPDEKVAGVKTVGDALTMIKEAVA